VARGFLLETRRAQRTSRKKRRIVHVPLDVLCALCVSKRSPDAGKEPLDFGRGEL
jgi:hypothetical protein